MSTRDPAREPGRVSGRALELAYRYLSRRERTVDELRRHLIEHDIDRSAAATTIQELTEQGYLDDARFARLFAQDKRELEQWGSERIKRALLMRGVDRELAESAIDRREAVDGDAEGELDRALGLLRSRFPDVPRGQRERERALGILLRKGYEPELALDALAAYSDDHE